MRVTSAAGFSMEWRVRVIDPDPFDPATFEGRWQRWWQPLQGRAFFRDTTSEKALPFGQDEER